MGYALHNVILNAREAGLDEGVVLIKAENVRLSAEDGPPPAPGNYIRISISDNGRGIPPEQLPQIFDPYYSTKGMGSDKGRGLGLAITHSVINKHGGSVSVDSEVGKGTTITIYLPASVPDSDEPEGVVRTIAPADAGQGPQEAEKRKILIMDDEDIVLGVAERLLTYMGCDVETARNGEEAITLYGRAREAGEAFHVVILDLSVQGGMGGRETIEKLREMDPGVTAVVSSGYSNDPIMLEFGRYGFKGALPKPYKIEEVRRALEGVSASPPLL